MESYQHLCHLASELGRRVFTPVELAEIERAAELKGMERAAQIAAGMNKFRGGWTARDGGYEEYTGYVEQAIRKEMAVPAKNVEATSGQPTI